MTKLRLHDYQERAVEFAMRCKKVFFAMDMGTGKTACALEFIKRTKQPAFIIAPLRVCYNTWPEEIAKWAPELTYRILHGKDKSILGATEDILIINYEGLKWLSQQKGKFQRRTIIYDESSMCKSHSTQRFKLLRKMLPLWNEYALALSATPAPNSLSDLWAQYFLLDNGQALEKNITAFRKTYCTSFSYPGLPVTLYKVDPRFTQDIYDKIAPTTFRLDAHDYLEMPPITYNQIKLQLTSSLARKYKELEKEFFLELEDADIAVQSTAALAMKLRQFIQGGLYDEEKVWHELHTMKLKALQDIVETSAGQPILCAIQFKGELAMIRKAFPAVPCIAGGCRAQDAQQYIKEWNLGKIPLLLCHPASISHGVNLQAGGHIMLWYGLPWSLEQYVQLNGRLYRQGQNKHVIVHHLLMTNTIDEAIMAALESKASGQSALLNYLREYQHGKTA